MIEKITGIKNPLTVVAIFAALAEISGTAVLPFLSTEHQGTYLWFLMLFPLFLVAFFFVTLNFNHRVLYAPSDFKDERHFMAAIRSQTPSEHAMRIEQTVREAQEAMKLAVQADQRTEAPKGSRVLQKTLEDLKSSASRAEQLVMKRLTSELQTEIQRNVMFKLKGLSKAVRLRAGFDGVVVSDTAVTGIEVKYYPSDRFSAVGIIHTLDMTQRVAGSVKEDGKDFRLILAIVTDDNAEIAAKIRSRIEELVRGYEYEIETRVYCFKELENT
jgi:hypothetical protein